VEARPEHERGRHERERGGERRELAHGDRVEELGCP
jgi:hypothetical protein